MDEIIAYAVKESGGSQIRLGKTFDDIIDSGLAFLTAVAWVHGHATALRADDGDGHIIVASALRSRVAS